LWEHQGPKKKRNYLWGTVTDKSREDTELSWNLLIRLKKMQNPWVMAKTGILEVVVLKGLKARKKNSLNNLGYYRLNFFLYWKKINFNNEGYRRRLLQTKISRRSWEIWRSKLRIYQNLSKWFLDKIKESHQHHRWFLDKHNP